MEHPNKTTDLANLFDPNSGIYANAYQQGEDWERPASVELINPDGSQGFQIDAGLRIRGGYSRSGDNPKHAFRLFFRGEYGASSLDFPLFGAEGADSFQKVEAYDDKGLVRTIDYKDYAQVSGIWTARTTEVFDSRRKSRTILKYEKLEYNLPFKDDEFTLQALRRDL